MKRIDIPLTNYEQTVQQIMDTASIFKHDLELFKVHPTGEKLSETSLFDYFEYVKNMPYRRDSHGVEVVPRPKYIFLYGNKYGRDCKKITVLLLAWAILNGIKCRVKVVSRREDKKLHHIYPELFINNKWLTCDATYDTFSLGQHFENTKERVFYVAI